MKTNSKYTNWPPLLIRTLLISPLIVGSLGVLGFIEWYTAIPAFLLNCWYWYRYNRRHELTSGWHRQLGAQAIALAYYLGVYVVIILLNGYDYLKVSPLYPISIFPYSLSALIGAGNFQFDFLPWLFIGCFWSGWLGMLFYQLRIKALPKLTSKSVSICLGAVIVTAVPEVLHFQHSQRFLGLNDRYATNSKEIDLKQYQPFQNHKKVAKLAKKATLTIKNNYPRINGATAAYPIESAVAQALYTGVDSKEAQKLVKSDSTPRAFERLIKRQADVLFMASPSAAQKKMAAKAHVGLHQKLIAKEAFVFFVNRHNSVDSLTVPQIQAIYQRRIANWARVGGPFSPIQAFQRPAGSGSQTIMESLVMKDKQMVKPMRYQEVDTMGGVLDDVAGYNNSRNAIGYSFRFYTTQMKMNRDIKILKINGVAPTVRNIRTGKYPLITNVYAVSRNDASENTKKVIEWVGSDQGQQLIDHTGYVSLQIQ